MAGRAKARGHLRLYRRAYVARLVALILLLAVFPLLIWVVTERSLTLFIGAVLFAFACFDVVMLIALNRFTREPVAAASKPLLRFSLATLAVAMVIDVTATVLFAFPSGREAVLDPMFEVLFGDYLEAGPGRHWLLALGSAHVLVTMGALRRISRLRHGLYLTAGWLVSIAALSSYPLIEHDGLVVMGLGGLFVCLVSYVGYLAHVEAALAEPEKKQPPAARARN